MIRPGFRKLEARVVSAALLVALLLPFAGMHMLGVQTFDWFDLSIVMWDFAILTSGVVLFFLVLTRHVEIPDKLPIVFYLIGAMVVWLAIEAARSPTPFRGWTMVMLFVRDFVMFSAVFLVLYKRPSLEQVNLWVSIIGIAFTAAAIPVFLMNVNTYGERLPFGGTFVLVEHVTPRFIGFARDPSFYGLAAAMSLMTLPFAVRIPLPIRWLGAALLITAIFFAGSRLLPASVVVGTAVVIGTLLALHQKSAARQLIVTLLPGLLIALIVLPVWFLVPGGSPSLGSRLFDRYGLGASTPRTALWAQTLDGIGVGGVADDGSENAVGQGVQLLLGNGLRSNQENLVGQYSHNTYLDLIGETGVVGLLIWLAITGVVTVQGFRAVRRAPELTPWLVLWLTTLVFFYGFSLLVAPYYWFIAAVITGVAFRFGSDQASDVKRGADRPAQAEQSRSLDLSR